MAGTQFYQPRSRGRSKNQTRPSTARPAQPVPRPRPRTPSPEPQQASEEEEEEQYEQEDEHPNKRRRGEEVDTGGEEWADAMELLDPRASVATMVANGNKHLYDEIRNITRLCGGHQANYANIVSKGIENYDIAKDDPDHPYWQSEEYDDDAEAYMLFPIFLKYFPSLHGNIDYLGAHHLLVLKLANFCTKVAKKSRSDDIGRVKLHAFAIARFEDACLQTKTNRGLLHVESAALLLPPRMLPDLRADPEGFLERLRLKEVKVFSEDWPSMMYDMSLYQPGQNKPGFLKSKFLRNMALTVFTSFSSTDVAPPGTSSGQGQPTVVKKHGMTSITIHAILYIAVLARFALTSHDKWSDMDGNDWQCQAFIKNILDFAHRNADWTDEITAWWNKIFFKNGQEEDDETRAQRQQTSYHQALASECTGRRKPPPRSRPQTHEPEPQANGPGET